MADKYDELKKHINHRSSDPTNYLPTVLIEIKEDVNGGFMESCDHVLRTSVLDDVKKAKNSHENVMVEIAIECIRRKTEEYYFIARKIFLEEAIVKWTGHEAAIERMTRILEEPIKWIPTKRDKERKVKNASRSELGTQLQNLVEHMIKACSRDNIIDKVAVSVIRLLTSCIKSGSDMHVVIAKAILRTDELTWEGCTDMFIPDILQGLLEWLRREDIDLDKNEDHEVLARAVTHKRILEKAGKNKHEKVMAEICIECMKRKTKGCYDRAQKIFREKTLVKWKGHEAAIEEMIQILEGPIAWEPTDDERKRKDKHVSWSGKGGSLRNAVESMIKACSRDKIIKKVAASFIRLLLFCLESGSDMHIVVAVVIISTREMSWEGNEKLIPSVLERYFEWLRRDDVDLEHNVDHCRLGKYVTSHGLLEHAGKSSTPLLKNLLEYCLEHELEEDNCLSVHGEILRNTISFFILRKADRIKVYQDLIPCVVKLLVCDVNTLENLAGSTIGGIHQHGEYLTPFGDDILEAYLEGKCPGTAIAMALKSIFQYKPEVVLSRIDRIAEMMEEMGPRDKSFLYQLLDEISKKHDEVLVPYIDLMFEDICNATLSIPCFNTLVNISFKHADTFVKHLDRCLQAWDLVPYSAGSASKIIANIGRLNKKEATKCLKILVGKIESVDAVWICAILMEMKRIGQAHKECLEVYRPNIVKLKTCQQMGVADTVQSILDFLDDRSLQGLSEEVAEQRDDIDKLDTRVTSTENDVIRIDETVAQQGDDIQNVKNEVNEQGERLDELKEVVDETVEKVEEIDNKTITNAPKWSRDVSKLLNPEHEHDWRFLAVRLGYSGEDIRNWALSPDPTMAILAEWYTTHKSSDATYAILNALEDMGRTDAAEFITQSLEEAELLVPQAPPDDSEKPPTVFLSYQWDHQPEVKAIKKHLEMAGFPCWMDIGQMGGGDQLFAKISQGMRSSKVVLCMVTEKYSNSENCNKEVNLANLLNKPIIPILIDHTQWPPQGAMSMLFAQLLYIQFFNDKEYVRGEKFWDDAKFSELLGQVSYHASPDESMVSDEYRDWIPQVEDAPVTVKKVSEEAKNLPAQQNQAVETTEHPSVFISYQWGKQPEIKRLFSRLTGLGYHCWLDINQMGGGDPLYSKIDKGVRNAKVVISCVTPKYALSPNCRREVSLSDALRKPIIPLLLEDMTWPPEGPMSMTFTQLLYIDFTKENTQASFKDERFDELVEKMKVHAQPTLEIVANEEQDVIDDSDQEQPQTPTPKAEETVETPETKEVPSSSDVSGVQSDSTRIANGRSATAMEQVDPISDTLPVQGNGQYEDSIVTLTERSDESQEVRSDRVTGVADGRSATPVVQGVPTIDAEPEHQSCPPADSNATLIKGSEESQGVMSVRDTPLANGKSATPVEQTARVNNGVSEQQSSSSEALVNTLNAPATKPQVKPPDVKNKKSSTCLLL